MTSSLGVVVPRRNAEDVRRALRARNLLRRDLAVLHRGGEVVFPVTSALEPLPDGARVEVAEFDGVPDAVEGSYRERVDLPETLRELLPRAFDVVGEIVLIRLPPEIVPYRAVVGAALLEFVPGARLVGWDRGVHGPERRRRLERIGGSGPWRTVHRENGIDLEVDVEAAYFSPRLAREHDRVALRAGAGERIFDLCCGVGPFALTIAARGRGREVLAVDLNPRAVELLRSNIARLGLGDRVRAVEADVRDFLRTSGPADRIILNLPHEGIKYLPLGLAAVERGGVLHYYEVTDRMHEPDRPQELLALPGAGSGWTAEPPRIVHPYSPTSDLVAYTLLRSGP